MKNAATHTPALGFIALLALAAGHAHAGSSITSGLIDFEDQIIGTELDDLESIEPDVGFGSNNGDIVVGSALGPATHTDGLGLLGSTSEELGISFDLSDGIPGFAFDIALGIDTTENSSVIVQVFDDVGASLGVFTLTTSTGGFDVASGSISIQGIGNIKSALISFDTAASEFFFDNLYVLPAPGAAGTLALAGLALLRRRR